ncbi:hypothetical protein SAMN02745206_03272 [Desulfacinum infernum DSM 9756]|uniref:Transposase, YhgA-like n=1 Tax=Desulfacinum infernum DSM 9756 TaxID=1121391 RepID=A0A1M5H419_9BACT|nr:hypothetical protein [Desulfacinum infernum]SHG10694.1 hypothetical protein SAMN02745206_03272 [Desulfacinum infernum DSM 9756]
MEESEILELPQETASVRRSDFPIRVRASDGRVFIVLLEVQSRWEPQVPLRLLEYDVRHHLKTGLSVLPVVMLLTPSGSVVEYFEDGGIRYRFRVVSLAAMDAREVVDRGNPCLMPFVGLMRGGPDVFQMAEEAIYGSGLGRSDKADLLTGMAPLTGLLDKDLPRKLLERRRDIMMESYAYELIKKEGYEEGLRSGVQQGIQQGIEKGTLNALRELILETLDERFEEVPRNLRHDLRKLEDPHELKLLFRKALRAESLHEFQEALERFLD